MNLLDIKYSNGDSFIDGTFSDQLSFFNKIITQELGNDPTKEQILEKVDYYLDNGEQMRDMVEVCFLTGELSGDEEYEDGFYDKVFILLLNLREPLGAKISESRGAGASNEV